MSQTKPTVPPSRNPAQKTPCFTDAQSLRAILAGEAVLRDCVVQGIDCGGLDLDKADVTGAVFLGCTFQNPEDVLTLTKRGALIFPAFPDSLPYKPYRSTLYTWQELMEGYREQADNSTDLQIYTHFKSHHSVAEKLAQRIHDHAIDDALADVLEGRKPVGIMGGHSMLRTDPVFARVAEIARSLARAGYFVISGGGPGVMEATNLGAYLAPHPDAALANALQQLAKAPHYSDKGFNAAALAVLDTFPAKTNGDDGLGESLAIPTWFYGHEPSNLFATHIAKYFANSLREDGLLAVATSGVVYAPGSAGTLQEVFMDLCQNHYSTFEWISPMVFLGSDTYRDKWPLVPFLETFARGRPYADYIHLTDEPEGVIEFIKTHPPFKEK